MLVNWEISIPLGKAVKALSLNLAISGCMPLDHTDSNVTIAPEIAEESGTILFAAPKDNSRSDHNRKELDE